MGELVKVKSEDIELLRCPSTDEERQELADAIFHLRQLMLEANFITDTVSAKVSKQSVLIAREMFKRFMDMFGDIAEEEVLNVNCTTILSPKIEIITPESGIRDKTTSPVRNKIPYAVKAKAVKLAEQHPRWSINTLRKNSTRFLKDRSQLARWKLHIQKGGTRYDKLAVINKDVHDRYLEARDQNILVTTPLLKQWAMAAAAQFLDGTFDFKASDGWVRDFRKGHGML